MGDIKKKQVRALITIEKDEEILVAYREEEESVFGPRETRRQKLLEMRGFLCSCSECSLEGEDLEDKERMRAEIWEISAEIRTLLRPEGSDPLPPRRNLKKAMKMSQRKTKLIQKLGLRGEFVAAMGNFYDASTLARRMDISIIEKDSDIFKEEALKYAKMFGDRYIYFINKYINKWM